MKQYVHGGAKRQRPLTRVLMKVSMWATGARDGKYESER